MYAQGLHILSYHVLNQGSFNCLLKRSDFQVQIYSAVIDKIFLCFWFMNEF